MITDEQIKANHGISNETILQDIVDTEREIKDKSDELEILVRNRHEHKVRIYMLEGGISSRQDFVRDLKAILEYRKKPQ